MTMAIEPTDLEWQEINDFRMPPCQPGDLVNWHVDGDTHAEPRWGYIERVDAKSAVIRLLATDTFQVPKLGVRHKDDPELRFKPRLRAYGVWDFHPSHKERVNKLQWLENRIRKLEGLEVDDSQTDSSELSARGASPEDLKAIRELTPAREQEIVDWAAEGMSKKQIAEVMGGGWNAMRVGKILKNTKLQASTAETVDA